MKTQLNTTEAKAVSNWSIGLCLMFAMMTASCARTEILRPLAAASISQPPETMTVRIRSYHSQPGKVFQNLFVSNFSVKVKNGQLFRSSSRDGMDDALKLSLNGTYGFNNYGPETSVTGFADLLLLNMGVQLPQQPLLYCAGSQLLSTSNDALIYNDARLAGSPQTFLGLRDCEKNYMGLDPKKFNNSGDGIPDYLKLRCGLNPANKFDAFVSSAGDGVANIDKCKMNIPINEDSRLEYNQLLAYQYSIQVQPDGSTEFVIMNIPILDGGKDNFLAFYVTESDLSDQSLSLYTAFAIVKAGYANKTLRFNYWATNAATFSNQEILVP